MQGIDQLIVVCVLVLAAASVSAQDSPVVRTVQGRLRGKTLETYTGKRIFSFLGVRYAEPPIGPNRFKAPVPVKSWKGVRDALEDAPLCPQQVSEGVKTDEDCLFLNVYSKTLEEKQNQPVIVYLHEGGFVEGTSSSQWRGPQYWLDQDVVLVTLNYRLGALGFLSTGDNELPGNYGLRDQLAVLRWVRQNIARFGGDPDSVTLFGYSVGASSAQLHMLSPPSRGLFHRVIASSCSATTPVALNRDPASLARRFAILLNCPTDSSEQIAACLRALPLSELLAATAKIWDTLQPPLYAFGPVVERHDGADKIIPDDPMKLLLEGKFTQVPLITGYTRDEFSWRAQYLLTDETYVRRINNEFDDIAPWEFHYPREPKDVSLRISAAFKKFYFNNRPVSNKTEIQLGALYADSIIIFSVYQAAKVIAEKSSAPVYFYKFNFKGRYSFRYKLGTEIPYGVVHHDDLIYLMYIKPMFPLFNQTDPEAYMVRTLSSIYTQFAKTGIPSLPSPEAQWTPMTKQHLCHLEIAQPPTMKAGLPYPERMRVWETQMPATGPYHQLLY